MIAVGLQILFYPLGFVLGSRLLGRKDGIIAMILVIILSIVVMIGFGLSLAIFQAVLPEELVFVLGQLASLAAVAVSANKILGTDVAESIFITLVAFAYSYGTFVISFLALS